MNGYQWASRSHFEILKRFIFPAIVATQYQGQEDIKVRRYWPMIMKLQRLEITVVLQLITWKSASCFTPITAVQYISDIFKPAFIFFVLVHTCSWYLTRAPRIYLQLASVCSFMHWRLASTSLCVWVCVHRLPVRVAVWRWLMTECLWPCEVTYDLECMWPYDVGLWLGAAVPGTIHLRQYAVEPLHRAVEV